MNSKEQEWNVFCSDARRNAFLIGDLSRNVYGSHYHVREPETQRLTMTFPGFAQSLLAWQTRKLLLQVRLLLLDPFGVAIISLCAEKLQMHAHAFHNHLSAKIQEKQSISMLWVEYTFTLI